MFSRLGEERRFANHPRHQQGEEKEGTQNEGERSPHPKGGKALASSQKLEKKKEEKRRKKRNPFNQCLVKKYNQSPVSMSRTNGRNSYPIILSLAGEQKRKKEVVFHFRLKQQKEEGEWPHPFRRGRSRSVPFFRRKEERGKEIR